MTKTAQFVPSHVKKAVLEFYVNLSSDMGNVASDSVYLAYVRGNVFVFLPMKLITL